MVFDPITADSILMNLFVDDGLPEERPHRKHLQSTMYAKTGIAFCTHKANTWMTDIVYAGDFEINCKGKKATSKLAFKRGGPNQNLPADLPLD